MGYTSEFGQILTFYWNILVFMVYLTILGSGFFPKETFFMVAFAGMSNKFLFLINWTELCKKIKTAYYNNKELLVTLPKQKFFKKTKYKIFISCRVNVYYY